MNLSDALDLIVAKIGYPGTKGELWEDIGRWRGLLYSAIVPLWLVLLVATWWAVPFAIFGWLLTLSHGALQYTVGKQAAYDHVLRMFRDE